MTINNKGERNYRGKCLGSPVTSYGGGVTHFSRLSPKADALIISPSNTVNSWAGYQEVDGPVIW